MRDTVNSQYDSFLYWRMPIPELDISELECLGLVDLALYKAPRGYDSPAANRKRLKQGLCSRGGGDAEEEEGGSLLPFSSFNFWRAPIASISAVEFDLL